MNWNTEWIWVEVKGEEDLIFIEASSDKKEEVTVNIYLKRTLCKKFVWKIYTKFTTLKFTFSNVRRVLFPVFTVIMTVIVF